MSEAQILPLNNPNAKPVPEATFDYLPVWKKNPTAEERFMELAMIARKHPERFTKLVVVHQEDVAGDSFKIHWVSNDLDTIESIGLLEIGKIYMSKYIAGS